MDFGTTGNYVAQGIFTAVGAFYGGRAGMYAGMAIGNYLFHTKESKKHRRDSERHKPSATIVKPSPVPFLIGTDMCPGNVIWIDDDVPAIVTKESDSEKSAVSEPITMPRVVICICAIALSNCSDERVSSGIALILPSSIVIVCKMSSEVKIPETDKKPINSCRYLREIVT
jgi:hypothetical protein